MTEPEVNSPPVPVAWEALEDAFENNSPEVHSYLQLETGEVLRIVDGVADPSMHARVIADPIYLRIDPVSSREQYRWMERFIATVPDGELRTRLGASYRSKVYPTTDLIMKNPYDFPVAIHYRVARGEAVVEILGKPRPWDEVVFERHVIDSTPFETEERLDDTLPEPRLASRWPVAISSASWEAS